MWPWRRVRAFQASEGARSRGCFKVDKARWAGSPGPAGPGRGRGGGTRGRRRNRARSSPMCQWRRDGRAGPFRLEFRDRIVGAPTVTFEPESSQAAQADSDSDCRCVRVQGSARVAGPIPGHGHTGASASSQMRGTRTSQSPGF